MHAAVVETPQRILRDQSARYPSSTNKEPGSIQKLELRTKIDDIGGLGAASTQVISMTTIEIRHGNCSV